MCGRVVDPFLEKKHGPDEALYPRPSGFEEIQRPDQEKNRRTNKTAETKKNSRTPFPQQTQTRPRPPGVQVLPREGDGVHHQLHLPDLHRRGAPCLPEGAGPSTHPAHSPQPFPQPSLAHRQIDTARPRSSTPTPLHNPQPAFMGIPTFTPTPYLHCRGAQHVPKEAVTPPSLVV